ncbi:MAG: entericidin A/B family lipoprotein [Xanthomonadaceae bacterium]|jgi:predicted small secreted protein|nr:entericidin A/B family lipoprotein [Xanthomonadaceae bacterium]
MKRVIALLLLSLTSVSLLSACNTIAGAGKDVERAGQEIQGAAKGK